ncbi:MAG: S41 family peptidase [bacterium]|nr:S41 family peptidase [bacterium]
MRDKIYRYGIGVIMGALLFGVYVQIAQAIRTTGQDSYFFSYYTTIRQTIDTTYVGVGTKTPSAKQLAYGALKGLVRSLGDPYSVFLTPEETEFINDQDSGSYAGIGATLKQEDASSIRIIDLAKDSSAEKGGLHVGDRIVAIDDVPVSEYSLTESVMHIRGSAGETVSLTVLREKVSDPMVFKIKREERIIAELHVSSRLVGKTGIIIVPEFGTDTEKEFYAVVKDFLSRGATSFIIDLRKNPGGSVGVCVAITSAWTDKKKLVTAMKEKDGIREYFSESGGKLFGKKTVVLVSGSSASASEILAGALQDWGAATVVGTTTFGKGVAQAHIAYPDGSSLILTVARWYTPSGREIHGKGIKPDIEVKNESDDAGKDASHDAQMERALEYLTTGR